MNTSARMAMAIVSAALLGLAPAFSFAAPIILNGGFESGFTAWTRVDQLGSDGSFSLQSGASSPVNFDAVPPPPEGSSAAMTDAGAPGSHVLYQDFVASAASATLSFQLFIGNRADQFATPASLAFDLTSQIGAQTLNQQARVDILKAGSDPFSIAAADILLTLYQSAVGDALESGYTSFSADISALLAANSGDTLRLRFAETDNLAQFQLGVDDVRIDVSSVPEPEPLLLLGAALAAWVSSRRMTRRLP